MNHVTSKHTASVDGKSTALAGCTNTQCPSYSYCLRSDKALAYRVRHAPSNGESSCRYLIPIEVAA